MSSAAPGSLFGFDSVRRRDPEVERWLREHDDELGRIAGHWYQVMRDCGEDVREVLHENPRRNRA